jgi:hypothetical protein
MDREEIGWKVIDTDEADLVPAGPWLEFHGDRCLPPPAARVLARNEMAVQAFLIGRHLAVQFHPECDGAQLKRWLDGGGLEHLRSAGVDPDQLLARTIREEAGARERADRLVAGAAADRRGQSSSTDLMITTSSSLATGWPLRDCGRGSTFSLCRDHFSRSSRRTG